MKLKELFWGAVFVITFGWFLYAVVTSLWEIVEKHAQEMATRREELAERQARLDARRKARAAKDDDQS